MKGKLVTMAVSFLLCVGMVGAGFASWVITSTAKDDASGKIAVDTVVDKRLQLAIDDDKTDLGVYFGAPKIQSTTNTTPWLKNDTVGKFEKLTAKVVVDLNGENLKKLAGYTVRLTAKIEIPTDNTAYNTAKEYNLISAPTTLEITKTVTPTASSTDQEVEFEFEFGWGSYFLGTDGNLNPYKYFNDLFKTSDATKTDGNEDILLPNNGEQDIDTTDVTLNNAGDYALFILGLIEDIRELDITVTVIGEVV